MPALPTISTASSGRGPDRAWTSLSAPRRTLPRVYFDRGLGRPSPAEISYWLIYVAELPMGEWQPARANPRGGARPRPVATGICGRSSRASASLSRRPSERPLHPCRAAWARFTARRPSLPRPSAIVQPRRMLPRPLIRMPSPPMTTARTSPPAPMGPCAARRLNATGPSAAARSLLGACAALRRHLLPPQATGRRPLGVAPPASVAPALFCFKFQQSWGGTAATPMPTPRQGGQSGVACAANKQ